jgi:hypothetical protein
MFTLLFLLSCGAALAHVFKLCQLNMGTNRMSVGQSSDIFCGKRFLCIAVALLCAVQMPG